LVFVLLLGPLLRLRSTRPKCLVQSLHSPRLARRFSSRLQRLTLCTTPDRPNVSAVLSNKRRLQQSPNLDATPPSTLEDQLTVHIVSNSLQPTTTSPSTLGRLSHSSQLFRLQPIINTFYHQLSLIHHHHHHKFNQITDKLLLRTDNKIMHVSVLF